ncbi:hypothetical protein pdam_00021665, partial [Pocillopora damicornis]
MKNLVQRFRAGDHFPYSHILSALFNSDTVKRRTSEWPLCFIVVKHALAVPNATNHCCRSAGVAALSTFGREIQRTEPAEELYQGEMHELNSDKLCQGRKSDKNKEKYQLGDKMIQYQILQTNITRTHHTMTGRQECQQERGFVNRLRKM